MGQDLRYALRLLWKNPGFTAVAALSIALGIGATTAIFSVVYAVLVDPYPYTAADRIGAARLFDQKGGRSNVSYTMSEYLEVRERARTVDGIIATTRSSVLMTGSGLSEVVIQEGFSLNAFDFFGVPPRIGRVFTERDAPAGGAVEPVAVLSYSFWQRRFDGQPSVLGRRLRLNDRYYTVIGVLPPRFTWQDADVYTPLELRPSTTQRVSAPLRIKAGVSRQEFAAEFQAFHERFAHAGPAYYYPEPPFRTEFVSVNDGILGKFANTLLALLGAVSLLLLIACGNVANLLLARATAREGEMAVRASVGASRARLVRQLLSESVLLACTGGALGVALAYAGVKAVVALMPEYSVPHEAVIAINWPVLWFALGVSVVTGILFGLVPALQISGTPQAEVMKGAGRGAVGSVRGRRMREALIVVEVVMSLVLLTGAGLAVRGLVALQQQELGYQPDGVLTFAVPLPEGRYTKQHERQTLFTELTDRLRRVPGVEAAAASMTGFPPWSGGGSRFQIDGLPPSESNLRFNIVSDGYFQTVGIPLLRGRTLSASDILHASPVGVVSEDFVKRHFPAGQEAIGRHVRINILDEKLPPGYLKSPQFNNWFEIIGIVGTARNSGLRDEPVPAIYIPGSVLYAPQMVMLLRAADPFAQTTAARRVLQALDAHLAVTQVRTLEEWLAMDTAYPRFATFLFGIFGAVGMVLAATGIFGVVSYGVAHRRREFGIRMALGASPGRVLGLVLKGTAGVLTVGFGIGITASVLVSRLLAGTIEGMGTPDAAIFVIVPAVLTAATLVASYVPARAATRIAPVEALRHE